MAAKRYNFVMEQTLGHVTFAKNLRRAIEQVSAEAAEKPAIEWLPVSFEPQSRLERLPVIRNNWSLRGSWQARQLIGAEKKRTGRPDLYFFHTQVVALLSSGWLDRRLPVVISLDATPLNYDRVGAAYGHQTGNPAMEKFKFWLNRRAFLGATRLVAWTDWTRRSLIEDYGVPAERIELIPAGTDLAFWQTPPRPAREGKLRLLFVGGDFERKGGQLLYNVYNRSLRDHYELHLVTKAPVAPAPGVHVYSNIQPNSQPLQELFRQADVFVLPTQADCTPHVLTEAMAAGLPVISTSVGAISEQVHENETGFLIQPGDDQALTRALTRLAEDGELRQRLGAAGRQQAELRYDGLKNARRLLDLCQSLTQA